MEIRIQSIHFTADNKLEEFVTSKVDKLGQFNDQIIYADVYLKFDNASHQVKDKTAEIKINIPGTTLFSSETAKSFEEAIDNAVASLSRQIKKHKSKVGN